MMNPNASILFGYSVVPSFGCLGDEEGGFSIHVKRDGTVIFKTYVFSSIPITETWFHIDSDAITEIRNVMSVSKEIIHQFPKRLHNGSCDGSEHLFIFNGKSVTDWNIEAHDIKELEKRNPEYLKHYAETIHFENEIMSLFTQITDILAKNEIILTLYNVDFGIPGKEVPYWHPYKDGKTIGKKGAVNATILKDEECESKARITLETEGIMPFAIVCVFYGLNVHVIFAQTEKEVYNKYEKIKTDILVRVNAEHSPPWWFDDFQKKWDSNVVKSIFLT